MDYAGPTSLGTQTFATRLMGKALYSTNKPDDTPGGCDWDKDGEDDCALTVKDPGPPGLPEDLSYFDASDGRPEIHYLLDERKTVDAVRDIIRYAVSKPECTTAFEAVGAMPIKDQLTSVVVVTEGIFGEPLYDRRWHRGTGVGKGMRETLNLNSKDKDISTNGTYKYLRPDYTFVDSQTRFLGITKAAIALEEYLSATIIHSFVHTGGLRGRKEVTLSNRLRPGLSMRTHDLSFLSDKYGEILKHCTRERGSKLL